MADKSRVVTCPNCERKFFYQLVRVRCPYCNRTMEFSLPEYEFHDGQIGCEHCHRKSHLKIGGYADWHGRTVDVTKPVASRLRSPIYGGRLLSIEPAVSPELILDASRKIPDGPRRDLESAVRCLEIQEFIASAMLARRCIQSALKIKGIPEGTPSRMINIARQNETISELAKKQSDAITFMGNKAAHPQDDPMLNLSGADIRQGLQMVRRILLELFDPDQIAVL